MKHIVCYSGGHSSGLVAVEVVRRFGRESVVLLNHDINPSVEAEDIKRFKTELADYLGLPITYANHVEWNTKDQFDVVIDAKAIKVGSGTALCTNRLKTAPFEKWLEVNCPPGSGVIYYGFDANEKVRIQRRSSILASKGYTSDYPLALWDRTIFSTKEIGVEPPNTYGVFKHANCTGCLKAGKQHWYIVYCTRKDLWEKVRHVEEVVDHSIIKEGYLEDFEPIFEEMFRHGITTTEHEDGRTFFARVRKYFKNIVKDEDTNEKPCECVF